MRSTTWNEAVNFVRSLRALPSQIWALGSVSLFMDVSSEMIHALLPVFLVSALGASVTTVGLIEGIAEATASVTKIFSGALSDRLRQRKSLAVVGYGMAALTKPLFPLAVSPAWVFGARFLDRIGKGVRAAPRDALIGEIAPPELRGAAYGLRQSMDTVGAFIGPIAAILLMELSGDRYRLVFWIAVVPAFVSVAILMAAVKEPALPERSIPLPAGMGFSQIAPFEPRFWWLIAVATVFGLIHFSEAFLVLRVVDRGLDVALAPLVLVVMNVVYAMVAYPAGRLSDRVDRWHLAIGGYAMLALADVLLAASHGTMVALFGVAVWGLHMGMTQGILSALVADLTPPDLRGTGFGIYNFANGVAALLASLGAGALWDAFGPATMFLVSGGLAAAAAVGAAVLRRSGRLTPSRASSDRPGMRPPPT